MAEELGNFVAGVDKSGIHSLCLEILDYEEKIKNAFQNISDSYSEAQKYLKGDMKTELDTKYNSLKKNYQTIVSNIDSYIDEFNALTAKEEAFDFQISQSVNAAINNIEIVEGDGN